MLRLHCPGVISKAKDTENCRYILLRIIQQLRLFRIIVSANQLSLYGAVSDLCEEFETHQDRSGQPDVLMGQSFVLSEIKTEVPLENDIPSHQNILLQRYEERIEMLSQENTPKNQLADILTKGNFTRDEWWNHLLCLFNISHFSSTVRSDTMAKRSQQDSEEERVTAKSRPMMNLIARTPSFVSSSTSVSPGKKHYGSQDPWSSIAGEDRSGRLGKETDLFEASDHY